MAEQCNKEKSIQRYQNRQKHMQLPRGGNEAHFLFYCTHNQTWRGASLYAQKLKKQTKFENAYVWRKLGVSHPHPPFKVTNNLLHIAAFFAMFMNADRIATNMCTVSCMFPCYGTTCRFPSVFRAVSQQRLGPWKCMNQPKFPGQNTDIIAQAMRQLVLCEGTEPCRCPQFF